MKQISLESETRTVGSKGHLRSIRVGGKIPATIYGLAEKAQTVSVNAKAFIKATTTDAGSNVVIKLNMGKNESTVLIKEVQRHITLHHPMHIDFKRISLKEKVEVHVPVHLEGDAPGVNVSGGDLEHLLREMHIRCLPTEIPSAIVVDISKLEIGQGIEVKDIKIPVGVEVLDAPDHGVVHVMAHKVVEEPTPEAAAIAVEGAAEPEVIAKGKKPEEGEAAKPAGGDAAATAKAAPKKDAPSKPTPK